MRHWTFSKSAGFILFFQIWLFPTLSADAISVKFIRGSLKKVQETAAAEGKLYFVNFTAAWCMPCRLMDETTFADPNLVEYVTANYLAAKIDIDDFDGVAYKNQYNVKVLPTIIVFNSKGKVVGRYEESLATSKMMTILKKYNVPENRVKSGAAQPTASPSPTTSTTISRPALKPDPRPATVSTPPPATVPSAAVKPAAKPASVPTGELYRFSAKKLPAFGFSVQIGVFSDYENVLRQVAKLDEIFTEAVVVHIAKMEGKTVYRVLVGEFSVATKAEQFALEVRKKGFQTNIKNLAEL